MKEKRRQESIFDLLSKNVKLTQYIPKANILNDIWLTKPFDTPCDNISTVIWAEYVN